MALHPDELIGSYWRDGLALAGAAETAGLGAPVPSCPDWSVADLVWHTGEVHGFWACVVGNGWQDPSGYLEPDRPDDKDLLAWYREGVDRALSVLHDADPAAPVWSWAPRGGTAGWVIRRLAHETAMHRGDAEAAAGHDHAIDPALAADGIDEFLTHFTGRVTDGAEPMGGTVHLHCTDVDGEWLIDEPDPSGPLAIKREHAKGDVAVRARASDLLLLLWRRRALEGLETFGDASIAERLVARANLS